MTDEKNIRQTLKKFCSAVILFSLCGFCGWIYETALTSYLWGRFADRGFLHIPILPIYGVFAFIMLPVFKKHNGWLTVFLGGMAITTLLELISSYIIEWVLGDGLWNYSSWDFNFQGRISLYSSLVFGVMSVILIKGAYPLVKLFSKKAPDWLVTASGILLTSGIIFDFFITMFFEK